MVLTEFIFFDFEENLTSILKERLHIAFSSASLDPSQFIHFIPFLEKEGFHSLLQQAHIYLDTIGFSGFNTAIQALICHLPIVTIEGSYMRGRLASGILHHSDAEYIERTVELIQNQEKRNAYKTRIAENIFILFNDLAPIRQLETLLIRLVKGQEIDVIAKNFIND